MGIDSAPLDTSFYGQVRLEQRLMSLAASGRILHALCICGDEGTGKLACALAFARALLCDSPVRGQACGKCASCKRSFALSHPDLHFIEPSGKDIMSVGVIRAMISEVSLKAYCGGKNVFIIKDAHAMNTEAQNALLKTLEEPPDGVVIVLLCRTLSPMLSTIISRSIVLSTCLQDEQSIAARLCAKGVERGEAALCAKLSGGSVGRAFFLSRDGHAKHYEKATDMLRRARDPKKLPQLIGELESGKGEIVFLLDVWQYHAAAALRGAMLGTEDSASPLHGMSADGTAAVLEAITRARTALSSSVIYSLVADTLLTAIAYAV